MRPNLQIDVFHRSCLYNSFIKRHQLSSGISWRLSAKFIVNPYPDHSITTDSSISILAYYNCSCLY